MPTTKSRNEYFRLRRHRKIYGDGPRVCAKEGCETVLNQYNLNMCCSLHNLEYVRMHKIKVGMELANSVE